MANDWVGMRDGLDKALRQELNTLVGGAIEDIDGPIRDAANRLVVAIRRGPAGEALVSEIRDELVLHMAAKEIKAKAAYANVFDIVLGTGLNLLFNGAVAGLQAAQPRP